MRVFVSALLFFLFANVSAAESQTASLHYRASIAFAVDSLARTAPTEIQDQAVRAVRAFVENPFTAATPPTVEQLNAAYEIAKKAQDQEEDEGGTFDLFTGGGGSADALGGLPTQAELIIGLTNFMVRRAQEELVFSFVDNLRIRVRGNTVVETVMPSSYAILQAVEPASFQVLLPQLRTAAEGDLRALPTRVAEPDVLDRLGLSGERRGAVQAASIVYQRIREMRGGVHPATSLANLRDIDSRSLGSDRLRTPLVLVGIVAREYSVHADSVRELMGVHSKRSVFARYLAEDLIERLGGAAGRDAILKMVQARQADVQQLIEELHQIDARVKEARAAFDQEATEGAATGAIDAALVLLGGARRYLVGSDANLPAFTFLESARQLNEAWVKRDYAAILGWLTAQLQTTNDETTNKLRTNALRYMSFAASLASAQTAEQVTVALRTAAGPVGSYRLKRQQDDAEPRPVAFFITGYVGGTAGYEYARPDSAGRGGTAGHFGPTVPVGFEAAWPKKSGSLSLFVPLLDLGTLASVRIGDDSVEQTPDLGFEQVFAPGVYAVWGIARNTPTVLGVGIQSAPALRRPSGGGSALDVWRLSVFFGIDVTILRL